MARKNGSSASEPPGKKETHQTKPSGAFWVWLFVRPFCGGVQKEQRGQAGGLRQPLRLDKTAAGSAVTRL